MIILIITIIILYIYNKFKPLYNESKILNISNTENKKRHANKDSKYAHYSKITRRFPSLLKYPKYYLSSPINFIVHENECLFIPKGWWHWVVSFANNNEYSFSINYWINKSNIKTPFITKNVYKSKINISNILSNVFQKHKFRVWCDPENIKNKTISFNTFINNPYYKTCYLISLQHFKLSNVNEEIRKKLSAKILTPSFIKKSNIFEFNYWLNNGNIDTGLHVDDKSGYLCVHKGYKIITLYPPTDTKYLYPHIL